MSNEFLKGNFKVKNPVEDKAEDKSKSKQDEFRQAALNSIGGSMVYVERTDLTWDPEAEESKNKEQE